ncbi:MAG: 5-formyltetrahydrofolate cyclo-ligase [Treponema sp.]|nr:5-formyltetrahydrofolate cyclo-ligase [Treponema sp.]
MLADLKKSLRKNIFLLQKEFFLSLSQKERQTLGQKLCDKITALARYERAEILFAYIPDKYEADCLPVIYDALKKGKKVCLPKVDQMAMKEGKSRMDFYFLDNNIPLEEQLEKGSFGIREPVVSLEKVQLSKLEDKIFMIVPGVAFSEEGKRLGHGKGFYDIYIERMKEEGLNPYLCGLCLKLQIVEDLPTDSHDILMDRVIF